MKVGGVREWSLGVCAWSESGWSLGVCAWSESGWSEGVEFRGVCME